METSRQVLNTEKLMKVVVATENFNFVKIGDSTILKLAEEYQ